MSEKKSSEKRLWPVTFPLSVGLLTLVVLVGGFGGWATFTEISGAVVVSGQIEVDQNRQIVQHPDGGIVEALKVTEGDRVEKGQTLIVLDTKLLTNRINAADAQLVEIRARRARFEAERDNSEAPGFPEDLLERAEEDPDVEDLVRGQQRLFEARLETATKTLQQLGNRRTQISRQIEGIDAQRDALALQVEFINEEMADQQQLLERGLAQSSRVLALQREAARLQGQIGELIAARAEAEERIFETENQELVYTVQRREDAITALRDIRVRETELSEELDGLLEQRSRTEIVAPVAGVVIDLTVFGEQAVVQAAEPVMYIVPQDRPLVIQTQVPPIHVDQVNVGQTAQLRFPSFDTRTTPELQGEVIQVSADSFVDETSRASFYRAKVVLSPGEIEKLPEGLTLIPGMPVDAYLTTADRSPLAYLTKPLTEYFSKAFREG
ncbi:HlyD family type I secretion periplasmic adaptor subunit [Palleronia caenipelagi]|uniref:Membrane fusion protein (MFP) family protein n=1 Tax=Palleronia caenipelagi TaxID=2489174 RepID=A0A547Q8A6_9RHOB|nr:HlyD family type I secretion periplasmic adaptor subunit [Palleronia caenipelagi]TRD22610.1 HlyD family type I secretion periplasmic adaptor subunit [Palleronia caenipelagi]